MYVLVVFVTFYVVFLLNDPFLSQRLKFLSSDIPHSLRNNAFSNEWLLLRGGSDRWKRSLADSQCGRLDRIKTIGESKLSYMTARLSSEGAALR
jgi:hypothetical protein